MIVFDDRFILDIIYGILILGILFFAIIVYVRLRFASAREWRQSIRNIYQLLLAQYLNSDELKERDKVKNRIMKICDSKKKKQILLTELIDLMNNFSGTYATRTMDLYREMKLYDLSIEKAYDQRWYKKIEGIVELSMMGHKDTAELLIPMLSYPDVNVRRHAKVAIVELHKINGLKEIIKYPSAMSNWTYLSILSILHRHPLKIHQHDLNQLKETDNKDILSLVSHLEKYTYAYS